jgi:hypothetical protein
VCAFVTTVLDEDDHILIKSTIDNKMITFSRLPVGDVVYTSNLTGFLHHGHARTNQDPHD